MPSHTRNNRSNDPATGDELLQPNMTSGEISLFEEEAETDPGIGSRQEVPKAFLDMLEVAGVPGGMACGQTIRWVNGLQLSNNFNSATVAIDVLGTQIEFSIVTGTSRKITLKSDANGDILKLQDGAGISPEESLSTAAARVLLAFDRATKELSITH